MLSLFDRMRVEDDEMRDGSSMHCGLTRGKNRIGRKSRTPNSSDSTRLIQDQKSRLLDLLLIKEIEAETYAKKATELRDREADLRLQLEACSRQGDEERRHRRQSV